MTKKTLTATTKRPRDEAPQHHFFASSAAEWTVGYDLETIIRTMKKAGYPFNIYLVPGSADADYQIQMYAPQVEGTVWLGFYGRDE